MSDPTTQDVIFNLIRGVSGARIQADDYQISSPAVISGDPNTEIVFTPKLAGGRYATQKFKYNRIDLSAIGPIRVKRGSAITLLDLLPALSDAAGLNVQVDMSEDPEVEENYNIGLTADDFTSFTLPLPSSEQQEINSLTLYAKNTSLLITGSCTLEIENVTVPLPDFSEFTVSSYSEARRTPLRLKGKVKHLTPGSSYKLCLYGVPNGDDDSVYIGSRLMVIGTFTANSEGSISFSEQYEFWLSSGYVGFVWAGVFPGSASDGSTSNYPNAATLIIASFMKAHTVRDQNDQTPLPEYNYATWKAGSLKGVVSVDRNSVSELDPYSMIRATIGLTEGRHYWELYADNAAGLAGVARITETLQNYLGSGPRGWGLGGFDNQVKFNNAIKTAFANNWNKSVSLGILLDLDAGTVEYFINNTSIGVVFVGVIGPVYPAVSGSSGKQKFSVTANFGNNGPFTHEPAGATRFGVYDDKYTPNQLPGLKRWYDASDSDTIVELSGKVAYWRDKSGQNAHAVQPDVTSRYVRVYDSDIHQHCMQNSGSHSFMEFPDLILPTHSHYVFVVMSNQGTAVGVGSNIESVNAFFFYHSPASGGSLIDGRGASNSTLTGLGTDAELHILRHTQKYSEVILSSGETELVDQNFNAITVNRLTAHNAPGFYLNGRICEVIIGDEALSEIQIDAIKAYLRDKWFVPST